MVHEPSDTAAAPATLVVELTQRCNHDCRHCYNAWKNERSYPAVGELGTADTLAMLDQALSETGIAHVTLSGGEPLLRPDLGEIVDWLAARDVQVNLISNGTLLDETAISRLAAVSLFELPLLSSEAALHDRLSGKKGAHDRVTMAMAELGAAGRPVVAVFVATRLNIDTLAETLQMAFALGAGGVMLNRFNPGGTGHRHLAELQLSPAELRAALHVANDFAEHYELPLSCSIAMPPCLFDHDEWPKLGFGFCAVGTERAYPTIDPAGNVRPCNHSALILGNVRDHSLVDLLTSPALRRFAAAVPTFCDDCPLAARCQGGCKAAAEVCCGDLRACDPFLAAYRSEVVKPPAEDAGA